MQTQRNIFEQLLPSYEQDHRDMLRATGQHSYSQTATNQSNDFVRRKLQEMREKGSTEPLYGQRFNYSGGSVSVEGCESEEDATWKAARMLFRSGLSRRTIRSAMTEAQVHMVQSIAARKFGVRVAPYDSDARFHWNNPGSWRDYLASDVFVERGPS